ncbi:glycoside hydrolase family 15 protein [Streptomyces sp. SBT349]|uniref:glycoside hydrolase family 15 protein n=1 Tax=Streptomyces sp. SBT349 TaxID=1580539 RepID=UPI00066A75CA|nr:glycoside hydrolase family 15 protein [Streptomyces sp. SBT349]
MADTPIEDYGLLSDRHSAALVGRDGTVDWLCFPRFDSPAVFGGLLDARAGSWTIGPATGPAGPPPTVRRRYLDGTMVLRTEFTTATGTVAVTDALATGPADDPHRLGAEAPHLLVRRLSCEAGEVEASVDFRPRPGYGLASPGFTACEGGIVTRAVDGTLVLSTPLRLTPEPGPDPAGATATTTLYAGDDLYFGLHWDPPGDRSGPSASPPRGPFPSDELGAALATTIDSWRGWSRMHQRYQGPWHELVHHSGRVLQALTYQPTGAIVAAATTSLPETLGGTRNWDYRYSWVRDAAFTMNALWVAACPDEGQQFFAFMTSAATSVPSGSRLQIMYGIGGEHDLNERELAHLSGWGDSRPVRVGNDAWSQPQLDVYGELLDTAVRFADQLDAGGPGLAEFLLGLADAAAEVWTEADHGIWEMRGERRHFLYSKLMCWVALDRALRLSRRLGGADREEGWRRVREEIRAAILERGWNEAAGAFTQSFGSTVLDASALMLPITGFLPADDPRVLATVDAVARDLTGPRGLVRRYRTSGATGEDGLAGEEGCFLLCTFWLSQAQAMAGRLDAARATFERAASHANDLSLLAEQVAPDTGRLLGNFPQAFSHIGLVNAAWSLSKAERQAT